MEIGIGIVILLSLLYLYVDYKSHINSKEWNNGKCPHCKTGIWLWYDNTGYRCTHCGKHLFKL